YQHHAVLGHRRDRLFVLALLFAHARSLADPGRRAHQGADGLRRIPQGNPASTALTGGENVRRHPPLDQDAQGGALRRTRTAGTASTRNPRVFPAAALKRTFQSAVIWRDSK